MGARLSSVVVLDSHVVHWWSAEPDRISAAAAKALKEADELAVGAISWFELGWLARHERILVEHPVRSWLERLAAQNRGLRTHRHPRRSRSGSWRR